MVIWLWLSGYGYLVMVSDMVSDMVKVNDPW